MKKENTHFFVMMNKSPKEDNQDQEKNTVCLFPRYYLPDFEK